MLKYKILEKIGQGSFGTVLKAMGPNNNIVAIKEIDNCNPFLQDKVEQQVSIMKKFEHPNLVKVYDSIYNPELQVMYIVMEYCETDLLQYYKKRQMELSCEQILYIFKQIAQAFLLLNEQGFIHRDLKPQNVLVSKDGTVKIADFGCARKLQNQALQQVLMSFDKGTATYASPEILKSQPYSSKCDTWSAGCLLYLLATGKHPFLQNSVAKTIMMIEQRTYGRQISIPKEQQMDPAIVYAIKRCLMFSQSSRCSWRQFSLCRLFCPKIQKTKYYLDYLKNISNIVTWISQNFWKERKQWNIPEGRDEIFMYFIIKVQWSVLELGQRIIMKDKMYRYLFTPEAYREGQEQYYKDEFKSNLVETKAYFARVESAISSAKARAIINSKKSDYFQCFGDIQNSIWAAQYLIDSVGGYQSKVWTAINKWVCFQKYFDFSLFPTLQKMLNVKPSSFQGTFTTYASLYPANKA